MNASLKYFGTDGIRASASSHYFSLDFLSRLSMAISEVFSNCKSIVIAWDPRSSSEQIVKNIAYGLTARGIAVEYAGILPTPGLMRLVNAASDDVMGIMISASHNQSTDNGIKIIAANGNKIRRVDEVKLEQIIDASSDLKLDPEAATSLELSIEPKYLEDYCALLNTKLPKINSSIVFDCANGAVTPAIHSLFSGNELVEFLYDQPNGDNINCGCGATNVESLSLFVQESKAKVGFAFDGDGDRLIVVLSDGTILDGDSLLYFFSSMLPNKSQDLVGTVLTNWGIENEILSDNKILHRADVGDRNVKNKMLEKQATIGGESSGHIMILPENPYGDGIINALIILELIAQDISVIFNFAKKINKTPKVARNLYLDKTILSEQKILQRLHDIKQKHDNSYIVVRASGTEDLIRIHVESNTKTNARKVVNEITQSLEGY